MADKWQIFINDIKTSIRDRRIEVLSLRSHGFITEAEYHRIKGEIDLYYGPYIDSAMKARSEHYANLEGIS